MAKALIAFLTTVALDWGVKSLPKADWWVPHYTTRPLWLLPIMFLTVLASMAIINTRTGYIAGGAAFGGFFANLIDLSTDGLVWNMIPIPGTDGFTCNVADFAIVGGVAVMFPLVILHCWRFAEQPV